MLKTHYTKDVLTFSFTYLVHRLHTRLSCANSSTLTLSPYAVSPQSSPSHRRWGSLPFTLPYIPDARKT